MDFMHVKLWLLLLYCCLVVILKNAEVSNGLLKFKRKIRQLYCGYCVERTLPTLLDTRKLRVSKQCWYWCMCFLKSPCKSPGRTAHLERDLICAFSRASKGSRLIFYLETSNTLSHNIITQEAAGLEWLFFPAFLWREESYFLCRWKTHYITADCLQPYLWLTYLQECFADIRHLIDCIHTILVFSNMLNVMHTEKSSGKFISQLRWHVLSPNPK